MISFDCALKTQKYIAKRKKMKLKTLTLLFMIFLTGLLSGCSSHMMDIKYKPSYKPEKNNISEKIYVDEVADSRGTAPNWLGAIRGGFGNPLKKLYTNNDTSIVVKKEFEDALKARNLLGTASTSQYKINVRIMKFDTSYFFNKEAHAHLDISLLDQKTGEEIFNKTYKNDNTKPGRGAGIFGDADSLSSFANDTLDETIDNFFNDKVFISSFDSHPKSGNKTSAEIKLKKIKALKTKGVISKEEYERKREAIINKI